ncbi:MAG: TolC family protein [Planctomycetota bacterium]
MAPRRRIPDDGSVVWVHGCAALALLAMASCESYAERALDPSAMLAALEREDESWATRDSASMSEAIAALRRHNPNVVAARATHAQASAIAAVATPPRNPQVGLGPLLFAGGGVATANRLGVQATLGWWLPLSARLARQDDVAAMRAQSALMATLATEREEYLALRRDWAAAALGHAMERASADLHHSTVVMADHRRRLAGGGGAATAVDVGLAELDQYTSHAAEHAARAEALSLRLRLAERCGLTPEAFAGLDDRCLPELPKTVPDVATLSALLPDAPALIRLGAEYRLAEAELHLEVARQYPDLNLGGSYERDQGVHRIALPFGIQLPVFDRNQKGIAAANGRRDALGQRYASEMRRRLHGLQGARALVVEQYGRWRHIRDEVHPIARELVELAQRAAQAGSLDAVGLLTLAARERSVRLDVLAAQRDLLAAWGRLEVLCGAPLLLFPDEPMPPLPTTPAPDPEDVPR